MLALTLAFQWIADNSKGEKLNIYSDSLVALTYAAERYYRPSLSRIKNAFFEAFIHASGTSQIILTQLPGHSGWYQNDYVDRLATHTLHDSPTKNPFDYCYFQSFSRDFLATPSAYSLKPHTTRTMPLQTATTITRCSAALGAFLVKMIDDAGFSHRRRFRLGFSESEKCRICHTHPETPEHL